MLQAFLGVISLAFTALPGLSYRIGRERGQSVKVHRGLRETALLLIPGLITTFAALALFGAIRGAEPAHTPDVGLLLREPGDYFRSHLPYVLGWMAGIVALASALGAVGGWLVTKGTRAFGGVPRSAWAQQFEERQKHEIYVHCFLTDGALVTGFLESYNSNPEETLERDICIRAPDFMHSPDGLRVEWEVDENEIAVISASQIRFLTVTAVAQEQSDGSGGEPVAPPS